MHGSPVSETKKPVVSMYHDTPANMEVGTDGRSRWVGGVAHWCGVWGDGRPRQVSADVDAVHSPCTSGARDRRARHRPTPCLSSGIARMCRLQLTAVALLCLGAGAALDLYPHTNDPFANPLQQQAWVKPPRALSVSHRPARSQCACAPARSPCRPVCPIEPAPTAAVALAAEQATLVRISGRPQ